MKIIQTFWSGSEDISENSFGWVSPKFHAIGWSLSVILLNKFYDVELFTDQKGYDFFIKKLKLPFFKTHIILDKLNEFHKNFWALPKIMTYSLQNEGFLHVDGDVFIFEPFSKNLLESSIISQNLEITTEYYQEIWDEIFPYLNFIPLEMYDYINKKSNYACNMGIFGGNNVEFIKNYSIKSFQFAEKNKDLPQKVYGGNFNIFFEQVLLFELLKKEGLESTFLIDEIPADNEYIGFGNFDEVPTKRTYLHLLGNYKRNYHVCKLMEIFFLVNYPSYFKGITSNFSNDFPFFATLEYCN